MRKGLKFKVGDRVRCRDDISRVSCGTGTITKVDPCDETYIYKVSLDHEIKPFELWYAECDLDWTSGVDRAIHRMVK